MLNSCPVDCSCYEKIRAYSTLMWPVYYHSFIISYEEETLYASHMASLVGEIKQYIEMFSSKAVRDLMSLLLLSFLCIFL